MNDDRRRLLISISAALVLHVIFLILFGLNLSDFTQKNEYGPLAVQVSLAQPKASEPAKLEKTSQKESTPAPAPLEAAKKQVPVPAPRAQASVQSSAAVKENAAPAPKEYTAVRHDDSILDSIKASSNAGPVDAASVFGDDETPAVTTLPSQSAASGDAAGSRVVASSTQVDSSENRPEAAQTPSRENILGSAELENLDKNLSASGTGTTSGSGKAAAYSMPNTTGSGTSITFDDPSHTRKLLNSPAPELPSGVQTAGKPRYVVVVEFDVDADGVVSGITVTGSSADPRVDAAVTKALREWSFEEARDPDAKNVHATLTYVIEIK